MNRRLVVIVLAIPLLLAAAGVAGWFALLHTESGAKWALAQLQSRSDGKLRIASSSGAWSSGLRLRDVVWEDGPTRVRAELAELQLMVDLLPPALTVESLRARSLEVLAAASAPRPGGFRGPTGSLAAPLPVTFGAVEVDGLVYRDADGEPLAEIDRILAAGSVHHQLVLHRLDLAADDIGVRLTGRAGLSPPYPIDASGVFEYASATAPEGAMPARMRLDGRIGGSLDDYDIDLSGWAVEPRSGRYQLDLKANGDLGGAEVSSLTLLGAGLQAAASGALDWRQEPTARLEARVQTLDFYGRIAGWPADHAVSGRAEIGMEGGMLVVENLELGVPAAGLEVWGRAELDLQGESADAELSWSGFEWPMGATEPQLQSSSGRLLLVGSPDAWTASGELDLASPGLPPGTLRLAGAGSRQQAQLTLTDSEVLGGLVSGRVDVQLGADRAWSAELQASRLDLGSLTNGQAGLVSADFAAQGRIDPFTAELDFRQFEGTVRQIPLQARGGVSIDAGLIGFRQLRLRGPGAEVQLDGSPSAPSGLDFSAGIEDLAALQAGGHGTLQAAGRLSLDDDRPRLWMELKGRDLAWRDGPVLDEMRLDIVDGGPEHAVSLAARHADLRLTAGLSGRLRAPGRDPAMIQWSGQLDALELSQEGAGLIALRQPAPLEASLSSAILQQACFGNGSEARLCLDGAWRKAGEWSLQTRLEQLPLAWAERFVASGFQFTQIVAGSAQWRGGPGTAPTGVAALTLSPGRLSFADDPQTGLDTGAAAIEFELRDGRLSGGRVDLPLPGQGQIDLDFDLTDVAAGRNASLEGRLTVQLHDVDFLTLMLPMVDQAQGRLTADLALGGTAGEPFLRGQIALDDGVVVNEAIGLRLEDVQLAGEVRGNAETELLGSFSTVEGAGVLQAVIDHSDLLAPHITLNLFGDNLLLFDSPALKLTAEPDLQLEWRDGIVDVAGMVRIPSARIAPRVIPTASVTESPDVVVVAGARPGAEPDVTTRKEAVAVRGELEVVLGDDVRLEFELARAGLTGSAVFTWQEGLVPLAAGEYFLDGEILAFGQLLKIAQGNLGFPNVPASDPHLNIRAEREIFGNSEVRRAGVLVTGTLRRPIVEPYTDPMTDRDRAQTLLVTGSDFNMETGVGAVDIGTYIAPRVFVSYGIGVFEDDNVISIRYDLGSGWGVKATSGQRQTGVDMSYTVDR